MNPLGTRPSASLFARMVASTILLLPVVLLLWVMFTALFGLIPLYVLDEFLVLDLLAFIHENNLGFALPTVSGLTGVVPLFALLVGVVTLLGLFVLMRCGEKLPVGPSLPSVPTSVTASCGVLGLYVLFTETAVVLPTSNPLVVLVVVVVIPFGGYSTHKFWQYMTRKTVDGLTETIQTEGVPATAEYPVIASTTQQLAQQASVPQPTVYVTDTDRAESFTLGTGTDAVVVVSTGLVETLDSNELTAVLAHEVSHLANGDTDLMMAAFTPLYILHEMTTWEEEERPSDTIPILHGLGLFLVSLAQLLLFRPLRLFARLGVSVLSVGREYAADAGGATLTGQPASLASALATLDDERTPDTDLREWEQTLSALDILPPEATDEVTGPFATHPETESRIERLETLAAQMNQE
jgi:heat shock protein HtpX